MGALAVAIVIGFALAPVSVSGQATASLKTPWGAPDLQGDWDGHSLTPLQRPDNFKNKPVLTPLEEAKVVADVLRQPGRDERPKADTQRSREADVAGAYNTVFQDRAEQLNHGRTSLVIDPPDGRIPPRTKEALAAADRDLKLRLAMRDGQRRTEMAERYNLGKFNRADGPEDRGFGERCLGHNLPVLGGAWRIVQSPNSVAIAYAQGQGGGFSRIIPIDGSPHLPSYIRSYWADARGRWEGDTLVVEVTNFSPNKAYQTARENLKLTERFTRKDAKTLEYKVTVEDPTVWTKPWTAMLLLDMIAPEEASSILTQQTCHEGNYGMIGVLAGHRAAEVAFAEGRGPDPFTLDTYSGGGAGEHDTAGRGIEIASED
jgi:hypothetical protein